jgi:hypothetical protein
MKSKDVWLEGWDIVRGWLPVDLDKSAKRNALWQRARGLQNAECWLRLILMHVAGGLSLEQTVIRARELGWTKISAVALFKRLCRAQSWLEDLTQYLLAEQRRRLGRRDRPFPYQLRIIDATDVQEPGSTGSAWRIHYSIRLPELVCDYCIVTDQHGGERLGRFAFKQDELILVDRGYSHWAGAAKVLENGAVLLMRWHPKTFPVRSFGGKHFDLLGRLRRLRNGSGDEWKVQFLYNHKVYRLRLCALRKNRVAAARARRKVAQDAKAEGRKASAQSLELAEYVLVLTSLPSEFTCAQVLHLYQCRWQIELVFKRLKSLLGAGQVPKSNDASARAWMQAKILCALLLERVLLEGRFFSLRGLPFRRSEPLAGRAGGAGFIAAGARSVTELGPFVAAWSCHCFGVADAALPSPHAVDEAPQYLQW